MIRYLLEVYAFSDIATHGRLATSYVSSKKSLNTFMYLQCKTGFEFAVCLVPTKCLYIGVAGRSNDVEWGARDLQIQKVWDPLC